MAAPTRCSNACFDGSYAINHSQEPVLLVTNGGYPPSRRESVRALRHCFHSFRTFFEQPAEENAAENMRVGHSTSRKPVLPKMARQRVENTITKHLTVCKPSHILARYEIGASRAPSSENAVSQCRSWDWLSSEASPSGKTISFLVLLSVHGMLIAYQPRVRDRILPKHTFPERFY